MTWQEDQERLARLFQGRSVIAQPVKYLQDVELAVGRRTVQEMRGTVLIADCFQALVVSSFSRRRSIKKIENLPQLCVFLSGFRTLRASYTTFTTGYYFEAAAGLRSLMENIYVLAAFAKGRIGQDDLLMESKRGMAVKSVAGDGSSLDPEDVQELKELKELLGMHVHGAKHVTSSLCLRARDGLVPSVEPYFDENEGSHYGAISICLSWPMLRLWRTLPDAPVGSEWDARYNALDAAMRSFVTGWGKPAALSIARWVDKELDFSQIPLRYPPANA